MKNNYFPHDCNATQDPKLMRIFCNCGLEGIGIYWIIIEILHQQKDGKLSKEDFERYIQFYCKNSKNAMQTQCDCNANAMQLQNELFASGLLIEDNNFVYSERVLENKKVIEKKSKLARTSASHRWHKQKEKCERNANAMQTQCERNANAMRLQCESNAINKIKKNKIKKNININTSAPNDKKSLGDVNNLEVDNSKEVANEKKVNSSEVGTINFDFVSGNWQNITENWKKELSETYPACNINQELLKIKQWLLANPQKKKKNYRRFINNWLSRCQDRGGTKGEVKKSGIEIFNNLTQNTGKL